MNRVWNAAKRRLFPSSGGSQREAPDPPFDPRRRPMLRDLVAEGELSERGYSVIDLLDPHEVRALYDFYALRSDAGEINPPGAYDDTWAEFTVVNSRTEFRRESFELITSVLMPRVEEHLIDCRPLIANFVNKPPGTGVVPVHQNMSVVDEGRFRSVSVWVALVDCVFENGTLQFVDHSHLAFRGRRGQWAYADYIPIEDTVSRYLTPVSVRAGQAIVLDDAVIHYSPPNETDARRLAIQFVMAPSEARTVYWEKVGEDEDEVLLEQRAVSPDYFFDFWDGVGRADLAEVVGRVSQLAGTLAPDSFQAAIEGARERAERSGTDPAGH